MPEEALDMALDDLVQGGNKGKGKGRGNKGGGKTIQYWGKGSSDRKGKGKGKRSSDDKENKEVKDNKENKKSKEASLDMSLDEVIVKDKGSGKRGKDRGEDWGKSKSKGKGKSSWSGGNSKGDSWKSYDNDKGGWNSDRKGSKGWSKGAYKGDKDDRYDRGAKGSSYSSREPPREPAAAWNQHDDRDDEEEDGWGAGRSARGGKGDDRREAGRPRGWSDNDRADRGLWQRVDQPREAPTRDSRREPVRDRREVGRGSKVAETRSAPLRGEKRRAVEEPEGSRSTKSIKVTNIPHDVNVQDIRDAFEQETGKITRCRLDRGTAWIAFQTSGAARKAVDTFDRGELNGQNIGVILDR